ncbi:MAG: DEAD/DEAH box helicase, partial [Elusimicrobia bacterium]|nr:DEAD/DEAH box helicase [Elusimicrobiota bacterium]
MSFDAFDLQPPLRRAVSEMGFEKPTPVQAKAIPPALAGRDILGSAQTGSGKTVAFGLPLLQRLLGLPKAPRPGPRALVLAPVRELAAQVEATMADLAQFAHLKTALVIGGESMNPQAKALQHGVDVVIATPGRLLDHLRRTRGWGLDAVAVCVLDEADRMLDMGFLPDVSEILARLPRQRQTLMFSATVPTEVERLSQRYLQEPLRIQIDPPRRPAEGVSQKVYPVSAAQKYDLLFALLEAFDPTAAVVFTSTKRRADLASAYLRGRGLPAHPMHSDLSQSARTKAMTAFREGRFKVLVTTDIAARGLDIRHVSHVVNFDVPLYPEDYLHRIGRTARAFTVGDALTLMGHEEKDAILAIEKFTGTEIPRCALEGFPYDVPPRLSAYRPGLLSRLGGGKRAPRRLM